MLLAENVIGVWLFASAHLAAPQVSATFTLRLPAPKSVYTHISLARDIEEGASFGIPGGDVPTEILPPSRLSAYILRWSKFDDQGFGGNGFETGAEPSMLWMADCVDVTFQLDALFRTGVATATVMAFD